MMWDRLNTQDYEMRKYFSSSKWCIEVTIHQLFNEYFASDITLSYVFPPPMNPLAWTNIKSLIPVLLHNASSLNPAIDSGIDFLFYRCCCCCYHCYHCYCYYYCYYCYHCCYCCFHDDCDHIRDGDVDIGNRNTNRMMIMMIIIIIRRRRKRRRIKIDRYIER